MKDSRLKKQRAFLKWAGGKYSLVDKIINFLPEGDLLIEPFVGAGSIFLNTDYDRYILADINNDLISLFNIIKRQPDKFIEDAKRLFIDANNDVEVYYQLRDQFNNSCDIYQRSLLFLYLNRHCYNGLCRYNTSGAFNVPFGQYNNVYFPEKELLSFSMKAKRAEFICSPYYHVMQNVEKGAVIYCDPPYAAISQNANFTSYYSIDFNVIDQKKLALLAETLSKNNIPVVISNHDTTHTRRWYKKAELYLIENTRSISCHGHGRKRTDELLALYL